MNPCGFDHVYPFPPSGQPPAGTKCHCGRRRWTVAAPVEEVSAPPVAAEEVREDSVAKRRTIDIGLATWRCLKAVFEPSREFLRDEEDPGERALMEARVAFLDSAMLNKWKARIPVPESAEARALLGKDLWAWGALPGLVAEFEESSQNWLVRGAFINMSAKLGFVAPKSRRALKRELKAGLMPAAEKKEGEE